MPVSFLTEQQRNTLNINAAIGYWVSLQGKAAPSSRKTWRRVLACGTPGRSAREQATCGRSTRVAWRAGVRHAGRSTRVA